MRYGGRIETNWEARGIREYSNLDAGLVAQLVADEAWSDEGLFGLLQGLRRLQEVGGSRVSLPTVKWNLGSRTSHPPDARRDHGLVWVWPSGNTAWHDLV